MIRDSDPRYFLNVIADLEDRVAALEQREVVFNDADEAIESLGQLDFRANDADGLLRVIVSGPDLYTVNNPVTGSDFGVHAHILGQDVSGVVKFYLSADDGTIWAENGIFNGTLTSNDAIFGGNWVVDSTSITADLISLNSSIPAILVGSATAFSTGTGVFIGKDSGVYKFRVGDPASKYFAWDNSNLTINANGISLNSSTPAILIGAATDYLTGNGIFMGKHSAVYKYHIGDPAAQYLGWDGTNLSANGQWIRSAGLNPALQEWTTSVVFSATSDTVAHWTSGTVQLSQSGVTYAITAGDTPTLSALTYIYLDVSSPTIFQTTTTLSTATGDGKILIATAQNATAGAAVVPFGGQPPIINGGLQINALSVQAGQIAAGAITASKISVVNLAAVSGTMGALTIDNTLTMSGASASIRIGTTPPTSTSSGTGLYIDRTGVYSLSSSVQNATLTSAGLSAAAGNFLVNATGVFIEVAATVYAALNAINFTKTGVTEYRVYGTDSGSLVTGNVEVNTGAGGANKAYPSALYLTNYSATGHNADIYIYADSGGSPPPTGLNIRSAASGTSYIKINYNQQDVDTIIYGTFEAITVDASANTVIFNNASVDVDVRMNGNTVSDMFFLDSSTDTLTIKNLSVGNRLTVVANSFLNLPTSGTLTIATGVITVTGSRHFVDTQAAAATDDLDTINGGATGDILVLSSASSIRDVTVKNGTGNINIGVDFVLSSIADTITLIKMPSGGWAMLGFGNNG